MSHLDPVCSRAWTLWHVRVATGRREAGGEIFMIEMFMVIRVHDLMRDEKEGRKKQAKGQTNNKPKQHSTPKAVMYIYIGYIIYIII